MTELPLATKNARGTKRKCLSCELPFYDLSRDPIVCPNCSETFVPPVAVEPRVSEPRPVSNVRRAPWSPKKVSSETDEAKAESEEHKVDAADEDDDEIKADDDTLLDPDAEIDDDDVVVAAKGDDD